MNARMTRGNIAAYITPSSTFSADLIYTMPLFSANTGVDIIYKLSFY